MGQLQKIKKLPLKTVYYLSFLLFIVIPILTVLNVALLILNRQFRGQAVENIRQAQETIIAELRSDIDVMSMRLSHLIYTNDNEILSYAAGTDTYDGALRYEYEQRLEQAGNLALEPVKDIISVGFYMKDGKETYIKSDIQRSDEEIRGMDWYQRALKRSNVVCLGSYDTEAVNDLYMGGKKDALILVFALAPDVRTDRSQKIEMVTFYQSTGAADRIREYNRNYLDGKNSLGITRIRDQEGTLIFSTQEDEIFLGKGFTWVRTPMELNDTVWYLESCIETKDLTLGFWRTALLVLVAAVLILALAGFYSRYFLRSIVRPVEEISGGLRLVEEGHLDIHIDPSGQYEIRSMIHQFNAMVRRLRALIEEYEERMRGALKKPEDCLAALIRKEMTPQLFLVFYRIMENDYTGRMVRMLRELQKTVSRELDVSMWVCIGKEVSGPEPFLDLVQEIRGKICLRHLYGENAVVDLAALSGREEKLLACSEAYRRLAEALYTADEKNAAEEKEKLFAGFEQRELPEMEQEALAVILAVGVRFSMDNSRFRDVFGQNCPIRRS